MLLACSGVEAAADHHHLKRALQIARCLPQQVREVTSTGETSVYEVECREGAGRVLTLVCTQARCLVDDHGRHANEEDEP
ncbi:hypothetical protein [Enterovirga aerilata]|uniref:PepSY domain-containing protein n=1 Tax=Enterovirga aerilata TaxID=2730920 RepID=A0A849ID11_9HYPH|nr:hypothetical protein [Enterovirga sp. DB1703]NNM73930.1 hypothetical protein [Enterovirga sp. DB1703]